MMIKRLTPKEFEGFKKRYQGNLRRAIVNPTVHQYYEAKKNHEKIEIGGEVFFLKKGEVLIFPSSLIEIETLKKEDFNKKFMRL